LHRSASLPLGFTISLPFAVAQGRSFAAWVGGRAGLAACPKNNKECRSPTRVNKTGEAAQGRVTPATKLGGVGQARRFLNAKKLEPQFLQFFC